jgi:hypothetical protein
VGARRRRSAARTPPDIAGRARGPDGEFPPARQPGSIRASRLRPGRQVATLRGGPGSTPAQNAARSRRARLIARIDEVFPVRGPDCGTERRIVAFLTDPVTAAGVRGHLGLPASAPPLTPARSPPRGESARDADPLLDLDQTAAFDPSEPDPTPDLDFDQTRSA